MGYYLVISNSVWGFGTKTMWFPEVYHELINETQQWLDIVCDGG